MLDWLRFVIAALLILGGLCFIVSSVVGVYRFRYVLNRMHAAALGDTLGILLIVLGLVVINGLNLTSRLEVTTNRHLEENMAVKTESDPHEEVES